MLRKLATLALSAALTLFLISCGEKSPKDVAVSFVEDIYKGNGDRLIKYIHLPQMETDATKEIVKGKLKTAAAKAKQKHSVD